MSEEEYDDTFEQQQDESETMDNMTYGQFRDELSKAEERGYAEGYRNHEEVLVEIAKYSEALSAKEAELNELIDKYKLHLHTSIDEARELTEWLNETDEMDPFCSCKLMMARKLKELVGSRKDIHRAELGSPRTAHDEWYSGSHKPGGLNAGSFVDWLDRYYILIKKKEADT